MWGVLSMDVAILVSSLCGGGAERIAINVAESLASKMDCRIIPIYRTHVQYWSHLSGTPIISYSTNVLLRILKRSVILYRYITYLRKNNVRVSLSILTEDNLINLLACFFTQSLPIISVHEMPKVTFCLPKIFEWIVFNFAKYSNTKIICVSNGVAESLINQYHILPSQVDVIYNPIDINKIRSLANEPLLDSYIVTDTPIILTVGRLTEVKAQWHLIRAFAELRKTIHCQLLICGIGDELKYLRELVSELHIDGDVHFLGWKDNPYIYMKRANLFVQSSLSEALPNVLIESMACGCPIVAAGCSSGIREIIGYDNSCGIVTQKMSGTKHVASEPLDPGELDLLLGMRAIMTNNTLQHQMSNACVKRAEIFGLEAGVDRYANIIRNGVT